MREQRTLYDSPWIDLESKTTHWSLLTSGGLSVSNARQRNLTKTRVTVITQEPHVAEPGRQRDRRPSASTLVKVADSRIELVREIPHHPATQVVRDKMLFLIRLFKEAGDAAVAQDRLDEGHNLLLRGLELRVGTCWGEERVYVRFPAAPTGGFQVRTVLCLVPFHEGSFDVGSAT